MFSSIVFGWRYVPEKIRRPYDKFALWLCPQFQGPSRQSAMSRKKFGDGDRNLALWLCPQIFPMCYQTAGGSSARAAICKHLFTFKMKLSEFIIIIIIIIMLVYYAMTNRNAVQIKYQ